MFRVFLLCFLVLSLACSSDTPPTGPVDSAGKIVARSIDRQALFDLYEVLADAAGQDIGWLKDGRWTSRSTIAKWYGVTLEKGRVVELVFEWESDHATTLRRPVFQDLIQALSSFTELRRVHIANFQPGDRWSTPERANQYQEELRTRAWPAGIANLSKLEYIQVPGMPLNLTGPATRLGFKQATVRLPVNDSFWNMTQLEKLTITGLITARATEDTDPENFSTWVWDYPQLEIPAKISQLTNLKKLTIGTGFSDVVVSLPETITQLTQLEELTVGPSTIQLPASLSALTNLQHLHITGHGQLPASWGQLASLKKLVIYSPQTHFWYGVGPYGKAGITRDDYDGYIDGHCLPSGAICLIWKPSKST